METVLLKDISDLNGNLLTDHLWFNYTKGFKNLGELNEGDVIQFDGRSKSYEKGYRGYRDDIYKPIETDYRFSHPTHVMVISRNQN